MAIKIIIVDNVMKWNILWNYNLDFLYQMTLIRPILNRIFFQEKTKKK